MHILYGSRGSGSAAVEAALEMAGLPYRIEETASWAQNEAFFELLKINPLGQVPTLVLPDGGVLSESAAILIHLGLHYPQSALLPAAPSARAQAIRGLVYIAANCYSAISVIDYPERWTTDTSEQAHERIRAGARARLHHHWGLFAQLFGGAAYLGGDAPGALDLLAAVVTQWSGARAYLAEHHPDFHRLLTRIDAHPSVAPVLTRHWPTG